jgi:hypothetical protein
MCAGLLKTWFAEERHPDSRAPAALVTPALGKADFVRIKL